VYKTKQSIGDSCTMSGAACRYIHNQRRIQSITLAGAMPPVLGQRPGSWGWVLGEGADILRELGAGECCKLPPSGIWGGTMAAKRSSCILIAPHGLSESC